MKKRFAIIENGRLKYAPKTVKYDHKTWLNPPERVLRALGYREVIYTDYPYDTPDGYYIVVEYEEDENSIYVKYVVKESTPIDEMIEG